LNRHVSVDSPRKYWPVLMEKEEEEEEED